jgi:hypothetical protein
VKLSALGYAGFYAVLAVVQIVVVVLGCRIVMGTLLPHRSVMLWGFVLLTLSTWGLGRVIRGVVEEMLVERVRTCPGSQWRWFVRS